MKTKAIRHLIVVQGDSDLLCHLDCSRMVATESGRWACSAYYDPITGPAVFEGVEPYVRWPACVADEIAMREIPPTRSEVRPCNLELKLLDPDEYCRNPDCGVLAGLHPNYKGGGR